MRYLPLGKSGIMVSELAFGTLPMGPLQAGIAPEDGARLIRQAFDSGVKLFDTATSYRTYDHLARGLAGLAEDKIVLSTKGAAREPRELQEHLDLALKVLSRSYLDIFHLHAARTNFSWEEWGRALETLVAARRKGLVRAIGISCHRVQAMRAAGDVAEFDVLFPLLNRAGLGIMDRKAEDMLQAVRAARARGYGIMAMKALAGGALLEERQEAIAFARAEADTVVLGMVSSEELDYNLRYFAGEEISQELAAVTAAKRSKRLVILSGLCQGCASCVKACPQEALEVQEVQARLARPENCLLCGYCLSACPQFAIRLV